jgi:hypothetical protein
MTSDFSTLTWCRWRLFFELFLRISLGLDGFLVKVDALACHGRFIDHSDGMVNTARGY